MALTHAAATVLDENSLCRFGKRVDGTTRDGSRLVLVLSVADVGEDARGFVGGHFDDRSDDSRVPLRARALAENRDGTVASEAFPVVARIRHRVVRVARCDDASFERDLFAGDLVGVSLRIEAFVMRADDRRDCRQGVGAAE